MPSDEFEQERTDPDCAPMKKHVTRIFLAGRQKLITDGLRVLFGGEPEFEIVGPVADGAEAAELIRKLEPDVVIVDLLLQDLNALSTVAQIRKHAPETKIVVLSGSSDESYVSRALRNGVSAYVLKAEQFSDLARAVREVIAGGQYLSPALDHRAISERQRKAKGHRVDRFETLTAREQEVLKLAARGRTSAQIARLLSISPRTAETHRSNIYKKLHIRNQADLIAIALLRGLISRDI
jgi:DNA-binding NarL/FixJ family response regulator